MRGTGQHLSCRIPVNTGAGVHAIIFTKSNCIIIIDNNKMRIFDPAGIRGPCGCLMVRNRSRVKNTYRMGKQMTHTIENPKRKGFKQSMGKKGDRKSGSKICKKTDDKKWSRIWKLFWAVPFIVGLIGYYWGNLGERGVELDFWEALYASAALYFVNPVAENSNVFIIIAKITALLVVAHLILSIVTSLIDRIRKWITSRHGDSTAVYSNMRLGKNIIKTAEHACPGTDKPDGRAEPTKDHIIMFDDDISNLSFYETNSDYFEEKARHVFIALKQVNPLLLKSVDNKNVHFFNLHEIEARKYWEKYNLYDEINDTGRENGIFRIAIIGYGLMGKAVFKQGFLNNIYRLDQKIEYHIWGAGILDKRDLEELNTANSDKIIVHDSESRDEILDILEMDRVIVTLDKPLPIVQEIIERNGKCRIYCYNKEGKDFSEFYNTDRLFVFGDFLESLTVDDIKTEKLYENAKLINYDYVLREQYNAAYAGIQAGDPAVEAEYMINVKDSDWQRKLKEQCEYDPDDPGGKAAAKDAAWDDLNGFTKGSNVARADYYWIEYTNKKKGVPEVEREEMEHIRWCRYHYFNGWKYAEGKKDPNKKTHGLLVAFGELHDSVRVKDDLFSKKIREKLDEYAESIYKVTE